MSRWRAASLIAVQLLIACTFCIGNCSAERSRRWNRAKCSTRSTWESSRLGLVHARGGGGDEHRGTLLLWLGVPHPGAAGSVWLDFAEAQYTEPTDSLADADLGAAAGGILFVRLAAAEAADRRPAAACARIITDPDGWTSFTTTDLLRSFPGLGMALFTFAICGFVLVYFLGSRSFCSYACPYGAIFAAAEQLSPLRIVAGPGECSHCGLCISSCKSSVRVIEEVQKFGRWSTSTA